MKQILSFVIFLCVGLTMLVAQPQKMSYQTVVRDANNELVVNKTIGMKVSVLHDSINGGAVYVETHNATTNSNGLVTIQIGGGTPVVVTNTLADVDWKNRRTFLKVEIDPNGGITYTITGVQEFMTVPYAFIANAATSSTYADTALFLMNAHNSDTAQFAYHSDTANYAVNANFANSSATATSASSANSANYSDSARIANSAISANYATNANHSVYADTATYALNAGHAANSDTALFSMNAGHSTYSDTSVYAYNANVANSATTANSANYADSTRIANSAISANYATNANHSVYADTATYALNAGHAANSDTALFSVNAGHANYSDTSVYAYNANAANSATTANSANYADSTRIANTAISANYATNANYANGSAYADSSNYDNLANRPVGTNKGDLLYWDTSDNKWHIVPVGNTGEILTMDSDSIPRWHTGTLGSKPIVTTDTVINISTMNTTAKGTVTSDGGSGLVFSGMCWSTQPNPTLSDNYIQSGIGIGNFTTIINSLAQDSLYYVRAFATNSAGTSYGTVLSIKVPNACDGMATVYDIDGNLYNTLSLGTQCWLKENLKTTRYANGIFIPHGTTTSNSSAYRYYPNNDTSYVSIYGNLYNWPAIVQSIWYNGDSKLCPIGWHVSTLNDWKILTDYIGSQSQYVCGTTSAQIAKSLSDTQSWNSFNNDLGTTCAIGDIQTNNNSTGFNAMASGYYTGAYNNFGTHGYYACYTDAGAYIYYVTFNYGLSYIQRSWASARQYGLSVRCVKN